MFLRSRQLDGDTTLRCDDAPEGSSSRLTNPVARLKSSR
jgi:hypothetical protein